MSADWRDEPRQLIKDCRARDRKLSAWEADFLDSIESWLDDDRRLTPKQEERLSEIWEKVTANG